MFWGQYYTRYDTLALVRGHWWHETLRHSQLAISYTVRAIRRLGLRVSLAKSEAIWFYDWRRRGIPPPGLCLDINREDVEVEPGFRRGLLPPPPGRRVVTFGGRLLAEDQIRDHRAIISVLSNWEAWRDRGGLPLSFRMTQVLIRHGVFGEYLQKFGRGDEHLLPLQRVRRHGSELCPAWDVPVVFCD